MNEEFDFCFKYIILGDAATGKTSLVSAFCDKEHINNYNCTIGVDFKNMILSNEKYHKRVKLHIWDTAGQEKFLSIVKSYFRKITVCIFVYDVDNYQSFNNIRNWVDELEHHSNNSPIKILVGNKIDFKSRQVLKNDIDKLAKEYDMISILTSAKKNINVEDIFSQSVEKALDDIYSKKIKVLSDYGITLGHNKKMENFTILEKKPPLKCCTIL